MDRQELAWGSLGVIVIGDSLGGVNRCGVFEAGGSTCGGEGVVKSWERECWGGWGQDEAGLRFSLYRAMGESFIINLSFIYHVAC